MAAWVLLTDRSLIGSGRGFRVGVGRRLWNRFRTGIRYGSRQGVEAAAETLSVHPIAIGILLALRPFRIIGIWHGAKTLAVCPVAVGVLLAFCNRIGRRLEAVTFAIFPDAKGFFSHSFLGSRGFGLYWGIPYTSIVTILL